MHACLDDVVVQSGQGYIRDKLADQDSSLCREFFSICLQHLVMALKQKVVVVGIGSVIPQS
jgi:hypothetical protein